MPGRVPGRNARRGGVCIASHCEARRCVVAMRVTRGVTHATARCQPALLLLAAGGCVSRRRQAHVRPGRMFAASPRIVHSDFNYRGGRGGRGPRDSDIMLE